MRDCSDIYGLHHKTQHEYLYSTDYRHVTNEYPGLLEGQQPPVVAELLEGVAKLLLEGVAKLLENCWRGVAEVLVGGTTASELYNCQKRSQSYSP